MDTGVEILLASKARIPLWVRNQTLNVTIRRVMINSHHVRSLQVKGAEASFGAGGHVEIKMPGSGEWWVAFHPSKVLEIRDLDGNTIKRNHYLCTECMRLTGMMAHYTDSSIHGRIDATFACTNCLHSWRLEQI